MKQQIVIVWKDEEPGPVRAAMWKRRGSEKDFQKAHLHLQRKRYPLGQVYTLPTSERDPLGKAKKMFMQHRLPEDPEDVDWLSPNPFGEINPEYQRKYEAGVQLAKRSPNTFELLRELRAMDADPVLLAGVEQEHRRRIMLISKLNLIKV